MDDQLLPYMLAIAVTLAGVFLQTTLKELISKHFSQLGKQQVGFFFYSILAIAVVLVFLAGNALKKEKSIEAEQSQIPEISSVSSESTQKSDAEVTLEAGKIVLNTVKEEVEKKRSRDSLKVASKKQIWVYRIGLPMKKDAAWNLFMQLKDIPGICFFKKSRKTYMVIKRINSSSEEEVRSGLESVTASISHTGEEAQVMNLTAECSKKEEVKEDESMKNKKENLEARCFICE